MNWLGHWNSYPGELIYLEVKSQYLWNRGRKKNTLSEIVTISKRIILPDMVFHRNSGSLMKWADTDSKYFALLRPFEIQEIKKMIWVEWNRYSWPEKIEFQRKAICNSHDLVCFINLKLIPYPMVGSSFCTHSLVFIPIPNSSPNNLFSFLCFSFGLFESITLISSVLIRS